MFKRVTFGVAILAVLIADVAVGQTWTGTTSGSWSGTTNWSPSGVPASSSGTALTFGASTHAAMSNDIAGTFQLSSLTFGAASPGYTLSGNQLNFRMSGATEASITVSTNNNVTISNAIMLGINNSGSNLRIGGSGTGTVTLNGPILDGGAANSLIYSGAGTLVLGSAGNTYAYGTFVNSGTLALGNGAALPAGQSVTVSSGAQLNLAGLSNASASAIDYLKLYGGTLRQPTGAGDYYLNEIVSTGGTIDFSGTSNFWLHVKNTFGDLKPIQIGSGTSNWIGTGTSRIQNDSSDPLVIDVTFNALLNVGTILSGAGSNPNFSLTGPGQIRLSNLRNSANLDVATTVLANDLTTNVGPGAFGVLGNGVVTLENTGVLVYDGPTAATSKSLVGATGSLQVSTPGVNLTLNGVVSGNNLTVVGPASGTSTVTLTGPNTVASIAILNNGVVAVADVTNMGVSGPLGSNSLNMGGGAGNQGTLVFTGTNAAYNTNLTAYLTGDKAAAGGAVIVVQNPGTNLTLSGPFDGPGSLDKQGPGTLTLSHPGNTYSLGTYVEAGKFVLGAGNVIPAGTDVTLLGGELNTGGYYNSSPIGTLNLNGGLMRITGISSSFQLNKLVVNSAASALDATAVVGAVGLNFVNAGAALTVNASNTWTGNASSILYNAVGAELPITISQLATLTSGLSLSSALSSPTNAFRVTGGGTLYLTNPPAYSAFVRVNQGRLRLDSTSGLAPGNFDVTLDGGTLQYSGPTASATGFGLGLGGGTLEVTNPATALTLIGAVADAGVVGLTKTGAGTLVLSNPAGGTLQGLAINAGRVDVAGDAPLGTAAVTVGAAGTLRFTATASTSRTITLVGGKLEAPSGVTLTFNGATINGGFLRGTGTFAATGGTTLNGTTSAASSTINVTGPASFVDFTAGGTLIVNTPVAVTPAFDLFTNQGSGSVTIAAQSRLNVSDFQTYGTFTINPASMTQEYAQTTLLTNAGASPLYFNGGSRTFIGTPATAAFPQSWPDPSRRGQPTFVAGIDLNGKSAIVAGGLFVNNGYVQDSANGFQGTATVVADFGALVKGSGFFQNSVQTVNGGKFQAGNSPGVARFGSFVLGPGGVSNYVFSIDDATGMAGPNPDAAGHVSGWGFVEAIGYRQGSAAEPGDFTWTATAADRLTLSFQTLLNPTTVGTDVPGMMDHFDPTRPYIWPAVEWSAQYAGPADVAALNAATVFDTTGFANPYDGTFGWQLDAAGHTLSLTYTPTAVPEPGTLALAGLAAVGWVTYWRRRWAPKTGISRPTTSNEVCGRAVVKRLAFGVAILAGMTADRGRAQIWTGAANGAWNNSGNWSSLPANGNQTQLTFGASANSTMTQNLYNSFNLQTMTFSAGAPAYTISGNGINFVSASFTPAIHQSSSNGVTFNAAVQTSGLMNIDGIGAGPVTFNGPVSALILSKSNSGSLTLTSASNAIGEVDVNAGTLLVNNPTAIGNQAIVGLGTGATMQIGFTSGNNASAPLSTLGVGSNATLRVPAGSADYYLNTLTSQGAVDFSGSSSFWLHMTGTNAAINANAASTWVGGGTSRIQNDSSSTAQINLFSPPQIPVSMGIILANGTSGQPFVIAGGGGATLALTNTANTANLIVDHDTVVQVANLAALGGGNLMLTNANLPSGQIGGALAYTGPTATLTKPITLGGGGGSIGATTAGTTLTVTGAIGELGGGQGLGVFGILENTTVVMGAANTYTGPTTVYGGGILAVGSIPNGGIAGPLGASTSAPGNLVLSGYGLGDGTLRYTGPTATTDRGMTFINSGYELGILEVTNPGTNLTVGGQIVGGTLTKSGPGTLTLAGLTNTFAGASVSQGTLAFASAQALTGGQGAVVYGGAQLQLNFGFGGNPNTPAGGLYLSGGTLRVPGGQADYYATNLDSNFGGAVDFSGSSGFVLHLLGTGADVEVLQNATWVGGGVSQIQNDNHGSLPITIYGGTLTNGITLAKGQFGYGFTVTGGGTLNQSAPLLTQLTVNSGSTLKAADASIFPASTTFTLDGGSINYAGPTGTIPTALAIAGNGGTLGVSSPAATLTISGAVTGTGTLTKAGPGTLTMSSPGGFTGPVLVDAGTLTVTTPIGGSAPITVNGAGTLQFAASQTTGRTFNLNYGSLAIGAGTTLTLDGAGVYGGFLAGPGTAAITGGTVMGGVTTAPSSVLNVSGPASFVNVTNGGALTMAAGPSAPTVFTRVTNQGSGSITLAATGAANASDFQSYGTVTISPATLTDNYSQTTRLTNTGLTPLYFNGGSLTFVGTPDTAVFPSNWSNVSQRSQPTFVAGIDLNGKNAVVAGGLFVNNGYVEDSTNGFSGSATVLADFGSLVKGAGFFQNSVQTVNGGKFQAGNSPGKATFGRFVFGPGGVNNYVFSIDDATGAAGPTPDAAGRVSGWGLVKAINHLSGVADTTGDFTWTATPTERLTVSLQTLVNPTTVGVDVPGPMDHFDPTRAYQWPAVEWTGAYTGPTDPEFLNSATAFDTTGFASPIEGSFGWALDAGGHSLSLAYTPTAVPEPGSLVLTAVVSGLGWIARRRRGSE
jgi:autotransporter-associated beta strand protein